MARGPFGDVALEWGYQASAGVERAEQPLGEAGGGPGLEDGTAGGHRCFGVGASQTEAGHRPGRSGGPSLGNGGGQAHRGS